MSPVLATFMQDMVLDPVKYRAFQADKDGVLARSGLDDEQRRAITDGDVAAINGMLARDRPDLEGARAAILGLPLVVTLLHRPAEDA